MVKLDVQFVFYFIGLKLSRILRNG